MNKSKWSNWHNLHCNTRVKKLKPSADLLKFPKCIFMLLTTPFANAFCQLPKTRSGYFSQYWPTDIFSQSINGIFLFTTRWLFQPITWHQPEWLISSLLAGWLINSLNKHYLVHRLRTPSRDKLASLTPTQPSPLGHCPKVCFFSLGITSFPTGVAQEHYSKDSWKTAS